jgi:hypothetical protein
MPGVPYTFGNATTSIPLTQLDANFNTGLTIGNTTIGLGNTTTTLGNVTMSNVTITSGSINASTNTVYSTANAVVYTNASKSATTGSALIFNGTNLGLGITPNAAWSSFSAIQLGGNTYNAIGSSNSYMGVFGNTYYDGSNFKYVSTAGASTYIQNGGAHYWNVATSGTAGNTISFNAAMTLDASNNLIVGSGTSSNGRLVLGTPSGDGNVAVSGDGTNFGVFRAQGGGEFQLGSLSSVPVKFITNSTARMTLNTTGAVALQGGASATGIGITFPATQSASSDANTLDDYEEGTWSPTLTASSGSATYAASNSGTYQKIGNRVYCYGYLNLASSSLSGQLIVGGLPFTSVASVNSSLTPVLIGRASAWNTAPVGGAIVNLSSSTFELYKYAANNNTTDSQGADTTATSNLFFSLSYITA